MQLPLPYHRGQKKPYGSIPRINWSHPLAQGLLFYAYDAGGTIVDLVSGRLAVYTSITGWQSTPWGGAMKWPSSSSFGSIAETPGITALARTTPYSVAMGMVQSSAGNADNVIVATGATDNSSNNNFGWVANNTTISAVLDNATAVPYNKAISFNTFQTWGLAATGANAATMYADGAFDKTTAAATTFSVANSQICFNSAAGNSQSFGGGLNGYLFFFAGWNRALVADEFRLLHDDPYCFLIYPEDEIFSTLVGAAGAPGDITGTLITTEAADVAAFAGDVVVPLADQLVYPGPIGTRQKYIGRYHIRPNLYGAPDYPLGAISGALIATEDPDVSAIVGDVTGVAGTLVATEGSDVAAFQGDVTWTGTLVAIEGSDTASMSGTATYTGTLIATEGADTASMSGTATWTGTLVATEGADTAAMSGSAAWTGALVATEGTDVAAFTGFIVITGALVATEGADTASFTGEGASPVGTLVATEGSDTAAMAGTVAWTGALVATEGADTAAMSGRATFTGTLIATEAADVAALQGTAGWVGTLAATEAADTSAISGLVFWAGTLVATEAADTANFSGTVISAPVTGTLVATEAQDIAQFVDFPPVTGRLVAMDGVDTCRILGQPIQTPGDLNFGWPRVKVRRRL